MSAVDFNKARGDKLWVGWQKGLTRKEREAYLELPDAAKQPIIEYVRNYEKAQAYGLSQVIEAIFNKNGVELDEQKS